MALGVNIQWGYAGLFNVGIMGFAALGGLAAVLVAMPPIEGAWDKGGWGALGGLLIAVISIGLAVFTYKNMKSGRYRTISIVAICIIGFFLSRLIFSPATQAIESINPAKSGYLGGLGLPIVISWPIGGLFAGIAAWVIGKITLGLRSDYLAIATLGISEIIIAVLKHEDWMTRGVKNVIGMPRPVPYEVNLQSTPWFLELCNWLGADPVGFFKYICQDMLCRIIYNNVINCIMAFRNCIKIPMGTDDACYS
jgi:branched-chain amino acid transport system permease protein